MKRLAIALLFSVFMGIIPISCNLTCRDSCCGETFDNPVFEINSLKINKDISDHHHLSNRALFKIEVDEYSLQSANNHQNNELFLSTALACSPPLAYATNSLVEVEIILKSEYLSIHDTDTLFNGETITDQFLCNYYSGGFSLQNLENFLPFGFMEHSSLIFYLQVPDYRLIEASVDIKLMLADGQEFLFENEFISTN